MAEKYIEGLVAQVPELAQNLDTIADFHKRRLWHQLTVELVSFVKLPQARAIDLVEFYQKFIHTFDVKLNQLTFVRIIADISQSLDHAARIPFVKSISELPKVLQNQEALIDVQALLSQCLILHGDLPGAKEVLMKAQKCLDATSGVDATVYSNFYKAWATYHKTVGEPQEFYHAAIKFIAYTPLETLSKEELGAFAFDLGIAALLGEEIFNFGDLLEHPVLESLQGTDRQWIAEIIHTFNVGDIQKWRQLQNTYATQLNQQDAVKAKHLLLDQKIRVMCLVDLLWKKPSDQRTVSIKEIASATELPPDEVEMLVMRTLSLGLIRGTIDEVDQVVSVTWVQPHILNMEQIASLSNRLGNWCEKVKGALGVVEKGMTTELGL